MSILSPPGAYGLPEKFSDWRPHQEDAIDHAVKCDKRFIAQCAPTGSGKSLSYVAAANMSANKAVILTSTKALQRQLMKDFECIGMKLIMGKNAYLCRRDQWGRGCDKGKCNLKKSCKLMQGGCAYYDALTEAKAARLLVTNYSYWLTMNMFAEKTGGLGEPDLLILDEAHAAPDHLSNTIAGQVNDRDSLKFLHRPVPRTEAGLRKYCSKGEYQVQQVYDRMITHGQHNEQDIDDAISAHKLLRQLKFLGSVIGSSNWYLKFWKYGVKFMPVWANTYSERYMFHGAKKVLLTSATVRPKTLEMLGLTPMVQADDQDLQGEVFKAKLHLKGKRVGECLFEDYPSSWNGVNRGLIRVPTVRINVKTDEAGYREWMTRIDQIIRQRLDRKGIIHCVSYSRRDRIMAQSEFGGLMITHTKDNFPAVIEEFKKATAPCILVSPAATTGFDFPDDECRYQIIGKLGFPDTRDPLLKKRQEKDPSHGAYLAMQHLVQACGRGVRSEHDWCENFLIDDSGSWFMQRFSHFAPRWFRDAYREAAFIPQPRPLN